MLSNITKMKIVFLDLQLQLNKECKPICVEDICISILEKYFNTYDDIILDKLVAYSKNYLNLLKNKEEFEYLNRKNKFK